MRNNSRVARAIAAFVGAQCFRIRGDRFASRR